MKKTKDYINLLPPEEKKPMRALNRPVLIAGAFAVAWLLVFGWLGKQALDSRSKLETLNQKKQARQQELASVYSELGIALPAGTSPEKAWLIQSILNERVLWSEVFKQFSLLVPKGMWFDSLEGNAGANATIKIRGGAFTYRTVNEFMLGMEKSNYFEKPQLLSMQKTTMQGQETVGFEIVCGIKR
jgi:Tfp pilus assembly protein PilN